MYPLRLNSGATLPPIGMGTFKLNKAPQLTDLLAEALRVGYRLIDSAICYRNEAIIGDLLVSGQLEQLRLRREDLFITTKIPPNQQGTDACRTAVLDSLRKLRLDYIDLVLIHWPGAQGYRPENPAHRTLRRETYEQLQRMRDQGLVREIGVSNYTVEHLTELLAHCRVKPAVNQVELHPYLYQRELLQFCRQQEILVQAYSPLGSASGAAELLADPVVQQVAGELHRTAAQVLLRWGLQHGCCVLPKTGHASRLEENFRVFDFDLSPEQMLRLDALDRNQRFCWDPTGVR